MQFNHEISTQKHDTHVHTHVHVECIRDGCFNLAVVTHLPPHMQGECYHIIHSQYYSQ